jgi:hypothetical protein
LRLFTSRIDLVLHGGDIKSIDIDVNLLYFYRIGRHCKFARLLNTYTLVPHLSPIYSSLEVFHKLIYNLWILYLISRSMKRSKWMYELKRMELEYVVEVKKFIAIAKNHQESLGQTTTSTRVVTARDTKGHEDATLLSHLIRFGFFKDYTVWTFRVEGGDASVGGSSSGGGNSSTTHAGGPPACTTFAGDINDVDHRDYIILNDLFSDNAGNIGAYEDVGATLLEPEDVELFKNIANRLH